MTVRTREREGGTAKGATGEDRNRARREGAAGGFSAILFFFIRRKFIVAIPRYDREKGVNALSEEGQGGGGGKLSLAHDEGEGRWGEGGTKAPPGMQQVRARDDFFLLSLPSCVAGTWPI